LILGALAGLALATMSPTAYTAVAYAIVVPDRSNKTTGGPESAASIAQSYSRVATTGNVVAPGLRRAQLPLPPDDADEFVRVSASPDAPIIEIFGTRESPEEAARLANAVLDGLSAYSTTLGPGVGYNITPFVEARPPVNESAPGIPFYVGLGGSVGLLIGGLLALFLELPNRTTRASSPQGSVST